MNLIFMVDIENALSQSSPVEALRSIIVNFNNDGVSKDKILEELHAVDRKLREQSRDGEADLLEDVIDMVSGYYVGMNLDLK